MGIKAKPSADMKPKTLMLGFDGAEWPYLRGRNTARIVRDVRQMTGMSVNHAEQLITSDPDVDVMATLLCAAMLQSGVRPDFEDLLDRITGDNPVTARLAEGVPDPEADGGN